jgi:radical SAM superfamily enzyme YgiQ (UPF0313 family)
MFLIEVARGCSRGCAYCVMRRTADRPMRPVPAARILELVPRDATRIGLVGAAVSDHPEIVGLVTELGHRGLEAGLSSLRPDRLDDALVGALKAVGYRTLTTALDGPSERLRASIDRRVSAEHIVRVAELCRAHKIPKLKLYVMLGLPDETDEDIDECAQLTIELSRRVPVSLAVSPFCSKRNTPLDARRYAGIDAINKRIGRLRAKLRGRAAVRATSARWGWVEHVLAQGSQAQGLAVRDAVLAGGSFRAFCTAFAGAEQA